MDFGIDGKTALVTAAGGGLGTAVVGALSSLGVKVYAIDISDDALQGMVEKMPDPKRVIAKCFDLSDLSTMSSFIDEINAKGDQIDILVNITGGPPPASTLGISTQDWEAYYQQMILPIFAIAARVVPSMTEAGWGRVITSTSSGIVTPIPNLAASNTLRSALLGWSKSLSNEVAKHGVTSNIVVPGRIATNRVEQLDAARAERNGSAIEDERSKSMAEIPTRRYGEPAEYANLVAFLASDLASYITGSTIRVDGGLIPAI